MVSNVSCRLAQLLKSSRVVQASRFNLRAFLSRYLLLITGCQRSGTTLMLLLLDAHSKILGLDESEVGVRLPFARSMLRDIVRGYYPCRKQPMESGAVDALDERYPHAEIVWMVRDPLSVVSSMRRLEGWLRLDGSAGREIKQLSRFSTEVETGIQSLSEVEVGARIWRANCKAMFEAKSRGLNVTSIKFEDLIEDTKEQLKKIVDRVGLRFEASMIDFHNRNRNQGRVLAGNTRGDKKINRKKDKKLNLTNEQKKRIIKITRPYLKELGYKNLNQKCNS